MNDIISPVTLKPSHSSKPQGSPSAEKNASPDKPALPIPHRQYSLVMRPPMRDDPLCLGIRDREPSVLVSGVHEGVIG